MTAEAAPFRQRLDAAVLARIRDRVSVRAAQAGLAAVLSDHPEDVAYLSGFFHHPGERPVAVLVTAEGDGVLLVPELERQHAQEQGVAIPIRSFAEYPGLENPFAPLADALRGSRGPIGVTTLTTLHRLALLRAAFPDHDFVPTELLTRARFVKEPEEIALHREAARITDRMLEAGVRLIADAVAAGGSLPSEQELAGHVGRTGTEIMYREHSDVVVHGGLLAGGLVYAGANSALPHGLPTGYRVRPGESLILSLGCSVGGRYVEGERTFVIGEPSARQRELHGAVHEAQRVGGLALAPGVACRDADARCLAVIRDAGLGQYLRHRQGHGIGLGMHEPPWLEAGDATELQAGMVVSNEPGLYVPGHAGYRISDSMLVTADGAEPLTAYPRSLDECVIPL